MKSKYEFPNIGKTMLVVDQMPVIVWRHRWNSLAERYGLPYRKGHIQNLDSKGIGPSAFI